jgi:hypothetical protein
VGLSERHEEPHLLVGDMTARHERSPCTENRLLSEPITTVRPARLGRNAGVGPLRSGYALPARPHPRVLILIDAGFSPCLSRGSTRTTRLRDVFDAILYMATTGCQWRMLPNDFPPVSTVRGYFYAWRNDGLLHEMNRASGRGPEIPANGGLHRLPKRGNY